MEQDLDNVFKKFNVNAYCISHHKNDNYQFYYCYLKNNGRLKDILSIKNELQLYLSLPNINIFIDNDVSAIKIESFSKPSKSISYDSIVSQRINKTQCFIGKDYYGNVVALDIAKCPHLLIGGASGSGKSMLLNIIIRNLLETGVTMYLCDPKRIEFNKYETDESNVVVAYDDEKITTILKNLVDQMNYSYDLISKYGPNAVSPKVVIIDEYGDLSSKKSEEFKKYLTILSQKARAAKIHIIVSTQRPSTSVIDGNIKANFSTRIALKTSSSYDSKIIIDQTGAEDLFGKGDAILKDQYNNVIRFQTAI